MISNLLSRRAFLTGLETSLVLAYLGYIGLRSRSQTYDIIVIGAGNAGMAAAVAAVEKGASVLVIDQSSAPGVGMHSDLGLFASPVSPEGLPLPGDSADQHLADTLATAGIEDTEPALIASVIHEIPQALRRLKQYGMTFADRPINSSSLRARCWQPQHMGYIEALYRAAKTRGVHFAFGCRVTDFSTDKGRIIGVATERSSGNQTYQARRGIILASGGFAANRSLVEHYRPEFKGLATDNPPNADGSILLLAQKYSAALIGMRNIQCIPRPRGNRRTQGYLHLNAARFIYCDGRGRRFVAEDAPRDILLNAFLTQAAPPVYEIGDDAAVKSYQIDIQKDLWRGIEEGTVFKADSLDALAEKAALPAASLSQTIAQYNEGVAKKQDPFGKAPAELTHTLSKPPFWAVRVEMQIHETLGGLRVNTDGAVLDHSGTPVPGLWAAGAIVGGLHGKCRLGGNGIASAIALGFIAGQNAAGEPR